MSSSGDGGTVAPAEIRAAELAGQNEDSSPGDSVLKIIQRFALRSVAW